MLRKTIESTADVETKCDMCGKGVSHLIAVVSPSGNIHVHAPFSDESRMLDFLGAIQREWNKNSSLLNKSVN